MLAGKRILVAPLNWGLGHATRCIPLIDILLNMEAHPVLGLDGMAGELLAARYPRLEHVEIPGHQVAYSKGNSQVWAMAKQMPALLSSIEREHKQLSKLISQLSLDAVISDQRFGLHAKGIPSIILTHQVQPMSPVGQEVLRKQNHRWLKNFDQVWIVDDEQQKLAGELSDPIDDVSCKYIGCQSRFETHFEKSDSRYRIVGMVSGPEPQRTLLEEKLVQRFNEIEGEHLLLAGQPKGAAEQSGNTRICGTCADAELVPFMLGCELLVSRSGYSSIMDLNALGIPALLIPTPGQAEQEFLAEMRRSSAHFRCQTQDEMNIEEALEWARSAKPFSLTTGKNKLVQALHELLEAVNT